MYVAFSGHLLLEEHFKMLTGTLVLFAVIGLSLGQWVGTLCFNSIMDCKLSNTHNSFDFICEKGKFN